MALRLTDATSWSTFFKSLGIPDERSDEYGNTFHANELTETELPQLDKNTLKSDLGITILAHQIKILNHSQQNISNSSQPTKLNLPVKLPEFSTRMSSSDFRTALSVWTTFKNLQPHASVHANDLLYSACDQAVQKIINNTCSEFRDLTEKEFLSKIRNIVTLELNPLTHRTKFMDMQQHTGETVTQFVARLLSVAHDCEYICPSEACKFDQTDWHVRDQLIKGICNTTLQADILSKCADKKALITLEEVVKYATAYESAIRNQETIHCHTQSYSVSHFATQRQRQKRSPSKKSSSGRIACRGCGSLNHGSTEMDRKNRCPAWGKTCSHCRKDNHYKKVCFSAKSNAIQAQSMTSSESQSDSDSVDEKANLSVISLYNVGDPHSSLAEIKIQISHTSSTANSICSKPVTALPDSGASICVAEHPYISYLHISKRVLQKCNKSIRIVGGSTIKAYCYANVNINIIGYGKQTKQQLYFTEPGIKLRHLYLSKDACIALDILPKSFPLPSPHASSINSLTSTRSPTKPSITNQRVQSLPTRPMSIPFPPTEDNITRLKQYILDSFKASAFDRSPPFPTMQGPPAHIYLKPKAIPYARHTPIPIPIHMEKPAKQKLLDDVEKGIVKPVPPGMITPWCSPMVTLLKKNGSIRRTIDLQKLNAQCIREAHYNPSPFKAACKIPPNTKKSILDITDGYHSVPLDEESQPLTTFITPWGRFMNTRLIQGFKSAGDIFNRNLDLILEESNIEKVQHVVDDLCLYESDIQSSFYQVWDFLTLSVQKGIVFNPDKFKFCQDTIIFAGLKITPAGIAPAPALLDSIKNFPPPTNIHDARSWHGLVNQISWAYAISPIMLPLKKGSKFIWDDTLQSIFEKSKAKLITLCEEGIKSFDLHRPSLIQCDWSKDGIGYLLLQKYCTCGTNEAPNCCPDGWHLVYAGSRHTSQAERNYAPIEGEALAVAWSLDHAKSFILGCKDLIVVTDHKPLIPLFSNRQLSDISNPRVLRFRSKVSQYDFSIHHCCGKWHRGPDALSRNPVLSASNPTDEDLFAAELEDDTTWSLMHETIQALNCYIENENGPLTDRAITIDRLQNACQADKSHKLLHETISSGFPPTRSATSPEVRSYWELRNRLSCFDNKIIVLDNKRFVIPRQLRSSVLHTLHSAHQGCTNMVARAKDCVYWPGMNKCILNFKSSCSTCSYIAPSQVQETIIPTPPPQWPFQQICADLFYLNGNDYLAITDRFSGWIEIAHFHRSPSTNHIIPVFEQLFTRFGCAEELSTVLMVALSLLQRNSRNFWKFGV
ncbi:uncharacterized protein LOC144424396 [Styela clava]